MSPDCRDSVKLVTFCCLRCVFKEEETLHIRENVPWRDIEFQDNQGCITMLERPPNGVLRLLDSQCKVLRLG